MRPDRTEQNIATLADIVRAHAATRPQQRAYTFLRNGEDEEMSLTFAELDRAARGMAAYLQARNLTGEPVLLSFPPGLQFIVAFLACLYAGVIAVPVTPPRKNQHGDRIKKIIDDSAARLALTSNSLLDDMRWHFTQESILADVELTAPDPMQADIEALAQHWVRQELDADALAFLQYTSGSTGTPKGVAISHGNLLHNERMVQAAFGHDDRTVFAGWLPMYHDMGLIGNALQPLFLGIHCVLMSPVAFLQKPIRWLQAISRYRATTSGAPNFAYDLCAKRTTPEQRDGLDLSSWKVAFNGAEPIRADTLDRFAAAFEPYGFKYNAFYPCYGMAETTLFVTGGTPGGGPETCNVDPDALQSDRVIVRNQIGETDGRVKRLVGCGHSWHGQRVVIVNPETRAECGHDAVGEIWISGGSVARGYWNNPSLTSQTFEAYTVAGDGPFLRTGDLGFLRNGKLFITGRLKDVIIVHGRNHYPQDIEMTVCNVHEAFRAGAGAAFTIDANGSERLIVVQEIERTWVRKVDPDELLKLVRAAVANEHQLQAHAVAFIKPATIPKTTSDKIRRSACRALYLAGELALISARSKQQTGAELADA